MSTNLTAAEINAKLMAIKEDDLVLRRPNCDIVRGTLRKEESGHLVGKLALDVRCGCGKIVRRATSDLHTWGGCPTCKKENSKLLKATRKVDEAEKLAKLRDELRAQILAEIEAEKLAAAV